MIKRVLVTGLCIGGLILCVGCGNNALKDVSSKETASNEEVSTSPVKVDKPMEDKIYSVEQTDIYEEYEGYTIKKMYAKMSASVGINIRKGPGEDFGRMALLSEDEAVNVIGQCKDTGWYMILYSGGVGFVSNQYLVNTEDSGNLVLGEQCPYYLYVKTEYNGQVGWFYRTDIGWQCKDYESVIGEIVGAGYGVEHFPIYVGTWRDVGDVMWIGYTKD